MEHNDKSWWDLSERADRKFVYERLLTHGSEASLILYLDGALLLDLWSGMNIPEPMRRHWEPVIEATLNTPIAPDSELYRRDEDTRLKSLDVVKHADS